MSLRAESGGQSNGGRLTSWHPFCSPCGLRRPSVSPPGPEFYLLFLSSFSFRNAFRPQADYPGPNFSSSSPSCSSDLPRLGLSFACSVLPSRILGAPSLRPAAGLGLFSLLTELLFFFVFCLLPLPFTLPALASASSHTTSVWTAQSAAVSLSHFEFRHLALAFALSCR